jgi:hypothetical protein
MARMTTESGDRGRAAGLQRHGAPPHDNALETAPTSVIDGIFKSRPRAYFEVEGAAREAPQVQFS